MKIKQLFLGSAVALMALTACNKNGANSSVPTPEVGATAGVLRIEIASANGGLRAATVDGPNADPAGAGVAGTADEQGVTTVSTYVFNPAGGFVDSYDYTTKVEGTFANAVGLTETAGAGKFYIDATNHKGMVLALPFKTTAATGVKNTLYVVINKPAFFPASFANKEEFEKVAEKALAIQDETDSKYAEGFKELTTANKFMMVGTCSNFTLTAGVTYDTAKAGFDTGIDAGSNQFAVTVDRVASKLVVDYTEESKLFTKKFGVGDSKAKLLGYALTGGQDSDQKLYYTLANSNKAMFIYNNPNVNDADGLTGVKDDKYVTPNMDKKAPDANPTTAEGLKKALNDAFDFYKNYFYRISEDAAGNTVGASSGTTPFTPMELGMQKKQNPYEKGVYFMEADNSAGKWLWANTPVAKIYACVLPSKVYYLGADKTSVMAKDIKTLTNLKEITEPTEAKVIKTVTGDGSFFMGADGKYYASQAAANVGAGKVYNESSAPATTKLYIKGRCVYRFPVNADNYDYTNFKNAYNKRNHIYALTISDIAGIGDNYDPTDPNDPNVPKPTPEENPNEPIVNPNKPIAKSTVYAAVKATVRNWTVVKNSVVLGK